MNSYAVISDVHANLEALHAVLEALERESYDALLFLGDTVGYGPSPNECAALLKEQSKIMLAGNHDWAAIGLTDISFFNPYAKAAIEWTGEALSDDNRAFLQNLPLTATLTGDNIYLVHATPIEPQQWHYVSNVDDAEDCFYAFKEKICFIGHSHMPFIVERSSKGAIALHYGSAGIKEDNRYIVNVGSVGQPRDGNPRAAYALLRGNAVEIKRVPYDIVVTQKKMKKAGLPSYLIDRLALGR